MSTRLETAFELIKGILEAYEAGLVLEVLIDGVGGTQEQNLYLISDFEELDVSSLLNLGEEK